MNPKLFTMAFRNIEETSIDPRPKAISPKPGGVLYTLTAHRYGREETHSYTVGVYCTLDRAKLIAEREVNFRGGKYGVVVEEVITDYYNQDDLGYPKVVWTVGMKYSNESNRKSNKINPS